jgi:hypothetical protein
MGVRWFSVPCGLFLLIFSGFLVARAQDELPVSHPECSFFGPQRDRFIPERLRRPVEQNDTHPLSAVTGQVTAMRAFVPGGPTHPHRQQHPAGSIDAFIFADFHANNIPPAPPTTDWEFIRRVTLDLTGRIPQPARVLAFVGDYALDKRAKLIEELLASPEWVDKWTMYFGDLFQNTVNKPSSGINRFAQGRNTFYKWIHDSLANGKPYTQMASELIATAADNSYNSGPINWLVGGWITNGPVQDATDQMAANVADTFLGITHVNCLLCHNGRGHLDSLSLWGGNTTRYQAWQLASYLSHTQAARTPVDPSTPNVYYWYLQDNTKGYTNDYTLNTTTGNRPARVAPDGCKAGQPCYYVAPQYIFNGDAPKSGENYRAAMARSVTGDPQFARAIVNYLWAQFFGRGIVDPPDTFDPARLDPNNPPPAPWSLQPSNAALLNALASHFVQGGYNLKSLMREIANSEAYQLSSRYDGQWNAAWEPYYARKFVRRLWAEEVHDAIVQSSGTLPSYAMTGFTDQGFAKVGYAMQLPDVIGAPTGDGNASNFLDSFLRGNRDDQPRRQDGSILQSLNVMNNPLVESRLQTTGATASQLIVKNLSLGNSDLVNTLYLSILSRYPSKDEQSKAVSSLAGAGNRTQAVQDLVWSLYNKVDFLFNY